MIRVCASLVGLAILVCSTTLNAQTGWWYAWDAGLAGYARLPLRTGNVPAPPYFALHPPVYYGQAHPRDYGHSPFAAWPCCQCRCRSAQPPQPSPARNPYVVPPSAGDQKPLPDPQQITSRSLLIENPYYQPSTIAAFGTSQGR
ncbi:MAG: hypothetical protein KatS3mg110_0528 [Pirellulaceae bacterium]|nr:MAG: hypothetical protein KatS3mg110_0528 [Pirellulaceae bacterium]